MENLNKKCIKKVFKCLKHINNFFFINIKKFYSFVLNKTLKILHNFLYIHFSNLINKIKFLFSFTLINTFNTNNKYLIIKT